MTISKIVEKNNGNKHKTEGQRVVGIITYMAHPYTCFQVTTCNTTTPAYFLIIFW